MKWSVWFEKDILPFFYFSRQERNGALVLLAILNLTWILPVFFSDDSETITAAEGRSLDSAFRMLESSKSAVQGGLPQTGDMNSRPTDYPAGKAGRFGPVVLTSSFDPNLATAETWSASGLPPWMIRNIQRYREKGGRFRRPEDLLRIYGMDSVQFRKILPFVEIQAADLQPQVQTQRSPVYPQSRHYPPLVSIDINQADSASWESLPGIGPVLASRIVRFRERLGGFLAIEQVREVYGIQDSTFRKIRSRLQIELRPRFVPLRINTAEADELALHPYVSRKLAALLVAYRKQHGPFLQAADMLAIPLVDSPLLNRIAPYLSFN